MTDHHPVTKEELEFIISIGDIDSVAAQDVLSRPDPLALLKAWRAKRLVMAKKTKNIAIVWNEETKIINQLRNNPEAVQKQGIKEGWYHD